MNNRHRRVARLKQQLESNNHAENIDFDKLVESAREIIEKVKNSLGYALESCGQAFIGMGRSLQDKKQEPSLMDDLTNEEWIALAHYIKGNLYIGGKNEGREERIETFHSAAIKIIRIGDVLEGDQQWSFT